MQAQSPSPPTGFLQSTILIVEDEPVLRTALRRLMIDEHVPSVAAASIAEARRVLTTSGITGVVLDYVLPDGLGDLLLDEIAAMRGGPSVLLYSAHREVEAMAKHYGVGFMPKPLDLDLLVAAVGVLRDGRGRPMPSRRSKPTIRLSNA